MSWIRSCLMVMFLLIGIPEPTAQNIAEDSLRALIRPGVDGDVYIRASEHLADLYFTEGRYAEALDLHLDLLRRAENDMDSQSMAKRNFNVGRLHYYFRSNQSNELSASFLRKALAWAQLMQDSTIILRSSRGIGAITGEWGQYDSSFYYLEIAKQTALQLSRYDQASGITTIQASYQLDYLFDTLAAEQLAIEAYHFSRASEAPEPRGFALKILGQIYMARGEYRRAEDTLRTAIKIYQDLDQKDGLMNLYSVLGTLYKTSGQLEKLSETYSERFALQQEVYNEDLTSSMAEMQTKYETEKKENENLLLREENSRQQATQRLIISVAIGFLLLAIIIFTRIYYRSKISRRNVIEEEQKNRYKAVINAQEGERKRIARDLHDGLGQLLSTAKLSLSAVGERASTKPVDNAMKMLDQAVNEVREISHNMMPGSLISLGLFAAIRQQAHDISSTASMEVHTDLPDSLEMPETVSIALYRAVQEIMNNILKYANAQNIWVMYRSGNPNELRIEDDGKGFDLSQLNENGGLGWKNIFSRMDMIHGQVNVEKRSPRGTTVEITWPTS